MRFETIVQMDIYGIRSLDFEPDVVYDIGAHVGIFTVAASVVFPDAKIIAVEPHPENYAALVAATRWLTNVTCVNAALGAGTVFPTAAIRGVEQVIGFHSDASIGVGELNISHAMEMDTVTLESLAADYPGQRTVWKIDIEGEEQCFVLGDMSDAPLRAAEYVTMEVHCHPNFAPEPRAEKMGQWIETFKTTHDVRFNPIDDSCLQMRKT